MKLIRSCIIPSCCYPTRTADVFPEQDQDMREDSILRFDSSEIERTIKNNSNIIAEGGFSTVYRARLPGSSSSSSPAAAAFKVHDQSSQRLYRMFCQERNVLLKVSHPNIVRLLGYSDDGEAAGVLVLEHVPNGTLHDLLHASSSSSSKFVRLSWPQRMSIAFQLAQALDYLHEGCDLQIIHGDIKPSNVLLDGDLSPKLCDFGFALMGFSATVARSASPMMMGSPGYVDPYYLRTGLVSKKSDVYSFGVLILELITGMEAFCEEKSLMLATVMRPRLQEVLKARELVDRRISGECDEAEVVAMAQIAAQCIGDNPSLRPSMGEVLKIMRERASLGHCCRGRDTAERQEMGLNFSSC